MSGRRQGGVAVGIVQQIDAGQARVRVDLPWLGDDVRSAWAPIATALAGGSRGLYFMPEVGDEVLLGFEHGDFEHPFVLGHLWNGVDAPPENDQHLRVLLTPGGHTLRFEDVDGAKKVVLQSAGGHRLTLDDAPGAGKVKCTTSGGQMLTLADVPGSAKLEIASGISIELGPSGVTLNVPSGAVTVNAGAGAVNLTAAGTVSVSAAALSVTAGVSSFSGLLRADVVQANVVSGVTYTPGVGNLI